MKDAGDAGTSKAGERMLQTLYNTECQGRINARAYRASAQGTGPEGAQPKTVPLRFLRQVDFEYSFQKTENKLIIFFIFDKRSHLCD